MNNLKYYIYSVVTLIFVAGIGFVYFHSNRDIEVHTNNDALINNDSLIVYKDKYNRTIYENKSLLVDLETIKSLHNREIDDLNKRINGLNNLVSTVSIKNVIKYDTITVLKDTIVYRNNDTIKTKHFEFIDKWSFINGVLYRDSISLNYNIKQNLMIDTYWKAGKAFSNKRELVIDVLNDNPHIVTNSINNVVIKDSPKKWFETRAFAIGAGFAVGLGTGIALRK